VFLTAKTTAMLWAGFFVERHGSPACSRIRGGQRCRAVGALPQHVADQFMILSRDHHRLGWPLEWTEIIGGERRADLPAAVEAFQQRSVSCGARVVFGNCRRVSFPAGRNVGVQAQGVLAPARHSQSNLRRP